MRGNTLQPQQHFKRSFSILNFEIGIVSDFLQYINPCKQEDIIEELDSILVELPTLYQPLFHTIQQMWKVSYFVTIRNIYADVKK